MFKTRPGQCCALCSRDHRRCDLKGENNPWSTTPWPVRQSGSPKQVVLGLEKRCQKQSPLDTSSRL